MLLAVIVVQGGGRAFPRMGSRHIPRCDRPDRCLPIGRFQGGWLRRAAAGDLDICRLGSGMGASRRGACCATMLVGNLVALRQRAERSGCWHGRRLRRPGTSSFRLRRSVAPSNGALCVTTAVIGYLVAYAAMNLGAFAVVAVGPDAIEGSEQIADYRGLRTSPPMARGQPGLLPGVSWPDSHLA